MTKPIYCLFLSLTLTLSGCSFFQGGGDAVSPQELCAESPSYDCAVTLAWQMGGQIPSETDRARLLVRIAIAQIHAEEFDKANLSIGSVLEHLVEHPLSPDGRAGILSALAWAQRETIGFRGTRIVFLDALEAAQDIDPKDGYKRDLSLVALAEQQATSGKTERAEQIAQLIENPALRAVALGASARALAIKENVQGNATAIWGIKIAIDDAFRLSVQDNTTIINAFALASIARAQNEVGSGIGAKRAISDALQLAERNDLAAPPRASAAEVARLRAVALARIAIVRSELGNSGEAKAIFQQALTVAKTVGDIPGRGAALAAIAIAQAQIGEFESAMQTVLLIEDIAERAIALADIAAEIARTHWSKTFA